MKIKETSYNINWAKDVIKMGIDTPWVKTKAVNEGEAPETLRVLHAPIEIKYTPFM